MVCWHSVKCIISDKVHVLTIGDRCMFFNGDECVVNNFLSWYYSGVVNVPGN